MSLKEIAVNYFTTFSNKDLPNLKPLFAENIHLRDWEIEAKGIENVLKANQNIFDKVNKIKVDPINIYEDTSTLICELIITINDSEILQVVDIIEFNQSGKIQSIKAYKGN